MKLYKISFIALALTTGVTSCNDYLEQEPPSSLTPENFYTSEDQVQAVANRFYQDILPGHGGWDYGTYTTDNNTDVQAARTPSAKFSKDLWRTSQSGGWSWDNIRNINFQLGQLKTKMAEGAISGNETNIRQYIGEIYFFRAYAYFELLKTYGDLPILTEALPDDESVLVAACRREPCNEVARFIVNNLDTAVTYMKEDFEGRHTRISVDAARLFKSRVALYMGSWLTNFAGTPFVPNGTGWPGAAKNPGYSFPAGSLESEAQYFFKTAADAAEQVADKYKDKLTKNNGVVPQAEGQSNPYLELWGTTSCAGKSEILLWREYSKSLGLNNDIEVAVEKGNIGTGVTRSLVERYLMADGKPIYNSSFTYDDSEIAKVVENRDPRLAVMLKVPGQVNCFKNVSDNAGTHWTETEPTPRITNANAEDGYITGYAIRKGMTHDRSLTANGGSYNVCVVFRATEALLNYIEAEYMLTGNINSGKILEYWKKVRETAGFTGAAVDPQVTIAATDMSKETLDWAAFTAGKVLTDATLYNIRRERSCEFLAEGLRDMDLKRWRSYEQLITKPVYAEGIHLWGTPMEQWYTDLVADGSSSSNVSQKSISEYHCPHIVNMTNNSYADGLTWRMAYYLDPLPLRQFLLTASDHKTMTESPLYQNPYWPMETDKPAEQ
jgi:hypothetical protein